MSDHIHNDPAGFTVRGAPQQPPPVGSKKEHFLEAAALLEATGAEAGWQVDGRHYSAELLRHYAETRL